MKAILFLLAMLFVQNIQAQNNAIDKYYKDFQQKNSLDVVTLSGKMLPLLIEDKKGKEKEELAAIINKLTAIKMLSRSKDENGAALFSSATSLMPKSYESILSIDASDRKVKCYSLENANGKISELVMIAWQWGRFMVLSITGDVDLNEIYKLTQSINFSNLGTR
jgi:hypothetical protein